MTLMCLREITNRNRCCQGGEIFDNALCGNGDPKQGLSSSGSIASYNIKAAIFMGDPRFEVGAPYNVGTCKAGGVCSNPARGVHVSFCCDANQVSSSLRVRLDRLAAPTTARSSPTVMLRIPTAAMAATLRPTTATVLSMETRL